MAKTDKITTGYLMRTISPLHAGSGDSDYGLIDKLVQRDSNNHLPTIHASSLKGALREYFEYQLPIALNNQKRATKTVDHIFGYGNKSDRDRKNQAPSGPPTHHAGLFEFDSGHLLSLPVRTDKVPFVNVTTFGILESFMERLELFGAEEYPTMKELLSPIIELASLIPRLKTPSVFIEEIREAVLEEADFKTTYFDFTPSDGLKQLLGERITIASDQQFRVLCEKLPVIARNKLDNGESQNLWYEETVPRESRFYTLVTKAVWRDENNSFDTTAYMAFDKNLTANLVQIGANATVGYGKTQFTSFKSLLNTTAS